MVQRSIFIAIRQAYSYLENSDSCGLKDMRLKTLDMLRDFVYEGSYTDYRKKGILLECERKGLDIRDTAIKLDVSPEAVRQVRKRISTDAYDKLGLDVVDKVRYGDKHTLSVVQRSINTLSHLSYHGSCLIDGIERTIKDSYIGDSSLEFTLNECIREADFLRLYNLNTFYKAMENLDSDKLNFLLRLLAGDSGTVESRLGLLGYVSQVSDVSTLNHVLSGTK